MKIKGNLRSLVRRFAKGQKKVYTDGDWKIAKGGYDCWFEIYLNDTFFISCIAGKLDGNSAIVGSEDELKKYLKIVLEEYELTYSYLVQR